MEEFLEEFDGPTVSVRNPTELSRFCDKLLFTFLTYRAEKASVKVEDTPFGIDVLYKGLWNACLKRAYRGKVSVHKQEDTLVLERRR